MGIRSLNYISWGVSLTSPESYELPSPDLILIGVEQAFIRSYGSTDQSLYFKSSNWLPDYKLVFDTLDVPVIWFRATKEQILPGTPGEIRTSFPQGRQIETRVVVKPLS